MKESRVNFKLAALVAFVLALSLANFYRAVDFEYADYDGFQYLSFSRSILSGSGLYLNTIRSPVLAVLIPLELNLARLGMIAFHLVNTALIFAIVKKLTKNESAALFSAFLYGTNWWMITFLIGTLSDLPAMAFFLASLLFWTSGSRKGMIYSAILAGFAFIARFDTIFLLLPLMAFTAKQHRQEYAAYFLSIALIFETATSWLAFGTFVYPPLEFLKFNFVDGTAFKLAGEGGFSIFGKFLELSPLLALLFIASLQKIRDAGYRNILFITLSASVMFALLPVPDYRIFMVKLIPLTAMLSAYALLAISEKITVKLPLLTILAGSIYLIYNAVLLASVQYPVWKLSDTPCDMENICTNAPPIVNYFCGKPARDIHQSGSRHVNTDELNRTEVVLGNLRVCDHLVYYNVSFDYDREIDRLIGGRYGLENETPFALVYDLSTWKTGNPA